MGDREPETQPRVIAAGRLAGGEEGQGLVEYALIIASVALVVFGLIQSLGTTVVAKYTSAAALFASSN